MGKPGKSRVKFSRDAPNADALRAAAARAATTSSDAVEAGEEEEEEEEEEKTPGINFVPCAAWVPRGASKAIPEKIELTKEELKRVIDETRRNLKDVEEDESEEVGESSGTNRDRGAAGGDDDDEEDIEAKYGFDDYDDDEAGDFGLGEVVEFGETADDPLIKQGRGDDSDSEGEDFEIRPTDNLIVTGHFEDHSSVLEVHVYNSVEGSLFVHHDMLLPACPLALEWIDCGRSGGKANLIAVGTMDPVIQVWDLDVVNCLEPCVKLGERISTKKKKKGGASGSNQCIGHTDAVLDLSWNNLNKQTLASGSVDQTTILWDFQRAKPTKVMRNFEEKVQSVLWHPSEVNMLLTGCGDGKARLYDAREEAKPTKVWKCGASVERVQWVPHSSNYFIAGLEGGLLDCYDARQKQRVWRLEAMTEPFADVAISTVCPGCVVTASEDGEIQIWDMQNPSSSEPSLIARHDMGVGKIMFIRFCPDEPFVICAGGDYGPNTFAVWDLRNNQAVADRFASRAPGSSSGGVEPMEEDS